MKIIDHGDSFVTRFQSQDEQSIEIVHYPKNQGWITLRINGEETNLYNSDIASLIYELQKIINLDLHKTK